MPTVISSDSNTSMTIADGDEYLLMEGITHYVTSGTVLTTGISSDIFVQGNLVSLASAVINGGGDSFASFFVGETGSITAGTGSYAVFNLGSGVDFVNHGTIASGAPINVAGSSFYLLNSGTISGIGSTVADGAVGLTGLYSTINNSGLIESIGSYAISSVESVSILNSGTISGSQIAVYVSNVMSDAALTLENSGEIIGLDIAVRGGSGDDVINNSGTISGEVDLLFGDDTYRAHGNGQTTGTVEGAEGNDTLIGGSLDDRFNGGDNADRLVGNDGNDNLLGGGSGDVIRGGDGNDFIDGEGGVDDVRGGNGADEVLGGIGDDTVRGGAGDDIVDGGKGNDDVRGGSGDDDVIGGLNKDQLFGGSGRDVFIFREEADSTNDSNRDFIKDFDIGEDLIDLSLLPGVLTFVGSSGFSGTAREVRVVENSAGNSVIYVDVDGDGTGDMRIIAEGVTGLSESDFLL